MNTAEIINLVPDVCFAPNSDKPVLMAPGDYEFALASTWKGYLYGRAPKLTLTFRVVTEGPYFGRMVSRYYNIKGLTKRGEIIPKGWSSDFVREYSRLFGAPHRLRDIGVRKYKNKILKGRVRTVDHDSKQRPLPDDMQYSVIDELMEVIAG